VAQKQEFFMIKYSVFIPFYNEEAVLEKNVLRVYNQLKKDGLVFELILVDDSSSDNSSKSAKKIVKTHPTYSLSRIQMDPLGVKTYSGHFQRQRVKSLHSPILISQCTKVILKNCLT
jgi:glycosyltransferase involved in cell wall biosynthesis